MAYTPTEWVSGTIISASKLNNIERGVESVNSEYTPTTWAEGDTVTAAKLNKIEQGIANASGGGSYPTVTVTFNAPEGFDINFFQDSENPVHALLINNGELYASSPLEYMYSGTYQFLMVDDYFYIENASGMISPTLTGGVTLTQDELNFKVTGDCSITYNYVVR